MTERELSEIARLNRSREGYRLALLQWADWAEENGLEYGGGLREMATATEPKRPRHFTRYPNHYGWFAYPEITDNLLRWEIDEGLLPYMENEVLFESLPDCVIVHYLDFFDAVREAAKAYVKAKQPAAKESAKS